VWRQQVASGARGDADSQPDQQASQVHQAIVGRGEVLQMSATDMKSPLQPGQWLPPYSASLIKKYKMVARSGWLAPEAGQLGGYRAIY
jgi:hypothetical protein